MLQKLISTQLSNALSVFRNTYDSPLFEKCIQQPEKKINVSFKYNDEIYNGFRIQYNSLLGPYKGGIRMSKIVDEDECTALSFWMTIKTALFNLPYGGGKGGIIADLQNLPKIDQEGICRAYVKSIYRDIGPNTDIPAPDLGSNSEMMDWMNDEYKKLTGEKSNGTFTGKTIVGGGSLGRTEATGYGVAYVTQYYVNKYMNQNGSYILQGFGNVGSHTALFMNKMLPNYKLIGVGDHTGYYFKNNGFDINYLLDYNKKNRSLNGVICDKIINKSEFFSLQCDIVIPAALELEVTEEIAKNLKCKLVVEGANGPLTTEADEVLNDKNIVLIPDVLANAGGVIVSYLEWYQNVNNIKYSYDEVLLKLDERLLNKMDEIYGRNNLNNKRIECYVSSLKNLYEAMKK